ncbi:MAG: ATP-binding protein [Candidatus Kapabacteria bacterium]|nr:ATP-binding protein [Candidatus Kapabacteria bacterium]
MKNPFIISGYAGAEYFCDREKESERLLQAAKNGRNIVLASIRRLGKTGLIKFFHEILKKETDIIPVYLDIMPTVDLSSFTSLLAKSVFEQTSNISIRTINKIKKWFSSVTPVISYDAFTGQPSLEFKFLSSGQVKQTLEEIFNYLKNDKRRFLISIDEFQQIAFYPEKNIEAILRSHIQNLNNVTFIFSGSKKHILIEMFTKENKPFFQSSEFMDLGFIDKEKYSSFIHNKFSLNGRTISNENIDYILKQTRTHTYYVQFLCNVIFSSAKRVIQKNDIDLILNQILLNNETIYHSYRNLLTKNQWIVLKAIAINGGVEEPSSSNFLKKYNLSSPSSVILAVNSLIDKELLYEENNKIYVSDQFFALWLKYYG